MLTGATIACEVSLEVSALFLFVAPPLQMRNSGLLPLRILELTRVYIISLGYCYVQTTDSLLTF